MSQLKKDYPINLGDFQTTSRKSQNLVEEEQVISWLLESLELKLLIDGVKHRLDEERLFIGLDTRNTRNTGLLGYREVLS